MKPKQLENATNWLVVIIGLALVILYLTRWPLSPPEPTGAKVPESPAIVSSHSLGLIGPAAPPLPEEVIPFAQTLYIHGVPYEAARQFGPEAVPILLDMLQEPANAPYATNIVVTLGFIGQPAARQPLLAYITQTQSEVSSGQFKGLMAVPFALAQLAHQGDVDSLAFLLRASEPDYWPGQNLPWANPTQTAPLYRQILLGLGISGLPQAQARLQEIAVQAPLAALDQEDTLTQALALNTQVQQEGMPAVVNPDPNLPPIEPLPDSLGPQAIDTNPDAHRQTFAIARHSNMLTVPTETEIDNFLIEGSRVLQTANSAGDVGCCVRLQRNGSLGFFAVTDGFISTPTELTQVFGYSGAQVKLVEALDYCGGYNPSIIGCAYISNRKNMILEFLDSPTLDGILWAHEFGHNQGLYHPSSNISTRIMNASLSSSSREATQIECNAWHNTGNNPGTVIGTCPFVLSALNTLEATSVVTSGARITYSLTIRNDSLETISNITVSDSLAAKTSYIAGSATASPAIISFTGFPTSTSAFTLAGNSSVKITYAVQVGSVNSKEILLNTATVSSPGRSAVQAVHMAIVDPVKTYLPLILTDE